MELYCGECSRVKSDVAYSVDLGGYVCGTCDKKLHEERKAKTHIPTLTWGGLR
jgi:hypothetical protein